jgi:hypothetical protein
MAKAYAFVTRWQIRAPLQQVWDTIYDSVQWPNWWKGVLAVSVVRGGDETGVGGIRKYTWRSVLPYKLVFDMELTAVDRYRYMQGKAFGELEGMGEWYFEEKEGITYIQYNWNVYTNKAWMNTFYFILKPAFEYNHNKVMAWGARGLAQKLCADLLSY